AASGARAEDGRDALGEDRGREGAAPARREAARGRVEEGHGLAEEPEAVADVARGIEHARVRPAVPGDERRGGRSLVEDVDPQELDPGSVAAGGLREVRGLLPARTAPGRPDVDDDRGPPELLEQGPVGVEVEARKRAHP